MGVEDGSAGPSETVRYLEPRLQVYSATLAQAGKALESELPLISFRYKLDLRSWDGGSRPAAYHFWDPLHEIHAPQRHLSDLLPFVSLKIKQKK